MDDTISRVLARSIRARRTELGYSQRRLAAEMTAAGCQGWTANTVAITERADRPRALSVEELGGLCAALRCSLDDLLQDMPQLTGRLHGQSPEPETTGWSVAVQSARRDELRYDLEHRLAESLEITPEFLGRVAADLYGRDVLAERDARVAGSPPGDPRDRAKRLGHATRTIRDELADYLDAQQLPEPGTGEFQ